MSPSSSPTHRDGRHDAESGLLTVCMELASSAVAALIALLATVLGFRLQERSAARRDRHAQQCAELRQVFVRFLSRLAAMRRLQNERSVLRESGASEAEQAAAKQARARTEAGVPAPWADRLPELAARSLDGDVAGGAIRAYVRPSDRTAEASSISRNAAATIAWRRSPAVR